MPTLLLTGATGFLGRAVARQAIAQGYQIIALVRPTSDLDRLPRSPDCIAIPHGCHLDAATTVQLSEQIREHLQGDTPDGLIHMAWGGTANRSRNAGAQLLDNLPYLLGTVQLAADLGCRQWLGIGSQTEYGHPDTQTDERAPTLPTSLYGQAKLAGCWSGLGLCQALGLTGTWVRIYQLYGPEDAPQRLVPYVIQSFLSGRSPQVTECRQCWDYLHVDDAARAILQLVAGNHGGIFNLGSGQALLLKTMVELIQTQCQTAIAPSYGAIPYPTDQVFFLQANIAKLQTATGWTPQIPIESGLQQTVDWFRLHPDHCH